MTLPSEPIREPPIDTAGAPDLEDSPNAPVAIGGDSGSGPQPSSDVSEPEQAIGRPLKLVVTLQPDGAGYRALLALGAEGCDPVFRSVSAADLATALDEAPSLLADAEERWQAQPRYPASAKTQPPARRSRPVEARPADAGAVTGPAAASSASGHSAASSPKSGSSAQMGLFG